MRFSIWPRPTSTFEEIQQLAQHCERTGWDGVYFADHFMPNGPDPTPLDGDTLECWSVLAGLAATVPRVKLAPLVTSVTYRHPAVLANIAAAVDQISGGRLTLGVGAGWQENEHEAYGIELGTVKERLDRFDEACQVLIGLLRDKRTTFDGEYFRVSDAPNQPAPVQPKLPILIGGGGEKRTLRIAAKYADEWNAWTSPEVLEHKVGVLRQHCEAIGRDPGEIHVSSQAMVFLSEDESWLEPRRAAGGITGTPDEVTEIVARYEKAGLDELIVPDFTLGNTVERRIQSCDLFIEKVAVNFR
jgi:F420-dependent oxidoreductase-like protein